jgi:hypothetical protein
MAIYYRLTKKNMKGKSERSYYAKAFMMGELHKLDLLPGSESGDCTDQ